MKMFTYHKDDEQIRSAKTRFRDQLKILARPEFGFIKAIIVNTLAMSILGLAVPVAVQSIINNIGVRTMLQPVIVLTLILVFILGFSSLLQIIQTYTIEILRRRLFIRFGFVVMERLERYQSEHFKKINAQSLINRYFDIVVMQSSMVNFFVEGAAFIIMFLIGFSLLAFYHPYFLAFGLFMLLFLIANWMLFGIDGVNAGSPEADGRYNAELWLEEVGTTRSMFLSSNARRFSSSKLTKLMNQWLVKRTTLFGYQFKQHIGLQIFSALVNILLVFLGSFLVLRGQLSVGQLVAAALVLSNIVAHVGRLQSFFTSIYEYSSSLDKIAEFYDHPLEVDASDIVPPHYSLRLEHVYLEPNYNFNFSLNQGSKNYIFVKSFSAMNKIIELIYGMLQPEKGQVFIGNYLYSDLDRSKVRDEIAIIEQNRFFSGTVLENLTGFLPEGHAINKTEIHFALEQVGMQEMIADLPLGLDTVIMPHGYPFTKSQILSLQVARTILMKPKMVIVTSDFEFISTAKRMKCLDVLTQENAPWTLLFFSQKSQKDVFKDYYSISRNELKKLNDRNELLKELSHG
jgi:putative ABC transport system ATP-binding protein